jgi:hypothetical protein
MGAPMFPIGIAGDDPLVVIDERGRDFVLDQAGEWLVGASLEEA